MGMSGIWRYNQTVMKMRIHPWYSFFWKWFILPLYLWDCRIPCLVQHGRSCMHSFMFLYRMPGWFPPSLHVGQVIIVIGLVTVLLSGNEWLSLAGLIMIGLGCAPIYPCIIHSIPDHFGKGTLRHWSAYRWPVRILALWSCCHCSIWSQIIYPLHFTRYICYVWRLWWLGWVNVSTEKRRNNRIICRKCFPQLEKIRRKP